MKTREFVSYAAGIALALAVLAYCSTRPESGPDLRVEAEAQCEDFVKARLKSPATAEFSDETTAGGGARWTITGVVDAENSFGAKVRSNYVCIVTDQGDTWRLESLTGVK